jgi:hypothetical protein
MRTVRAEIVQRDKEPKRDGEKERRLEKVRRKE